MILKITIQFTITTIKEHKYAIDGNYRKAQYEQQ